MATKKIRYVGPHEAVYLPLPDGREEMVERHHQVEVPTDLANSLLEQEENWKPAPKRRRKSDDGDLESVVVDEDDGDEPEEDEVAPQTEDGA